MFVPTTVADCLRYAMTQFNQAELCYGHGTDNPWDEALHLVLGLLHLPFDINPALLQSKLIQEEADAVLQAIEKRIEEQIPVPYLTNKAYFADLELYVNEHVLVPRSPIAEIIQQGFEPWIQEDNVHSILDLCTGSGCLALLCALHFPEANVTGSDLSEEALQVAEKNRVRYGIPLELLHSDGFNDIPEQGFDVIISNPPYVDPTRQSELPKEFSHEPAMALYTEDQGLRITDHILKVASRYLNPQGILIVEVGESAPQLIEKYPHVPFTWLEFAEGGEGVFLLRAEDLATPS